MTFGPVNNTSGRNLKGLKLITKKTSVPQHYKQNFMLSKKKKSMVHWPSETHYPFPQTVIEKSAVDGLVHTLCPLFCPDKLCYEIS